MLDIPLTFAFSAGLISFLAPCVLPLIPGYLAYLAGTNLQEAPRHRREIVGNAVLFVLGFALVFALLGILLNTVLERVAYDAQTWLARIGGLMVVFFGLYLTGLFHIPWLEREHKVRLGKQFSSKYVTSFIFGAAFAAGWTPCAGAALGSILGLATTEPGAAFPLLLAYAIGFGIPLILLASFIAPARSLIQRMLPWVRTINILFGLILIIFGLAIFTQTLNRIADFSFISRWLGH